MKKTPITFAFDRPQASDRLKTAWCAARNAATAKASATNELLLYDVIGLDFWTGGGITPGMVNDWLDKLPADTTEIVVRINSPGGSVFDGVAIYNALVNSGKRVVVKIDSLAASIASIIAMAGDEISIAGNGQIMIHKAWSWAVGNADDFLKEAAALESIDGALVATYVARTGQSAEAITKMMGEETWLNAEAAKEKGFVETIQSLKTAPEKQETEKALALQKFSRQKLALMQMQTAIAAA